MQENSVVYVASWLTVVVESLQAVDVDVRFCSSGKGEGLKYLLGTAL